MPIHYANQSDKLVKEWPDDGPAITRHAEWLRDKGRSFTSCITQNAKSFPIVVRVECCEWGALLNFRDYNMWACFNAVAKLYTNLVAFLENDLNTLDFCTSYTDKPKMLDYKNRTVRLT